MTLPRFASLTQSIALAGAVALLGNAAQAQEAALPLRATLPNAGTVTAVKASMGSDQDTRPCTTPREALLRLESAARSGDPERAVPLFAEPFGSALKRTFEAGHLMMDASRRLHEVVAKKLGDDAARSLRLERRMNIGPRLPNEDVLEIVSIHETSGGAKAVIRPKTRYGIGREESIELVKQGEAWKLLPPAREGYTFGETELLQMELLTRGLENAAAAVVKLSSDVQWGSVTTIADCRDRLQEADMEILRAISDDSDQDDASSFAERSFVRPLK
jgi:hypothetical protein